MVHNIPAKHQHVNIVSVNMFKDKAAVVMLRHNCLHRIQSHHGRHAVHTVVVSLGDFTVHNCFFFQDKSCITCFESMALQPQFSLA